MSLLARIVVVVVAFSGLDCMISDCGPDGCARSPSAVGERFHCWVALVCDGAQEVIDTYPCAPIGSTGIGEAESARVLEEAAARCDVATLDASRGGTIAHCEHEGEPFKELCPL